MGTKEAVKRNQSSMQVLKTLKLLLEDNYTMTELIQKLNSQEKEPVFNNSVVSKYINTCRFCGMEIPKIHNKYFVSSVPFGMDLTAKELNLIEDLRNVVKNTMSVKADEIFEAFLEKLSKYSNKQIIRVEPRTQQKAYELFDRAIAERRKINLLFRAKAVFECIPLGIVLKKGKTCFHVIHDGKEKMISAERISGLEIMDRRFIPTENTSQQEVIFRLKGKLAGSYTLRENEQVMPDSTPESLVVSNKGEDKEALFARLLRYDSSCEILFPIHYREEMKNLLDKMLKNYGV
ncbi:MAG: WYL domain-containing protein [Candidatus Gastranaerophilales bacterium]|nr:WYL domain-containing protein [Candidatus Gastranaerophilales bacterium]MCM1073480.1 WYL domain-containing protein [Bacteroides sp.]